MYYFQNLASETLLILKSYDWPGNVRQLKNILEWLNIMYGKQKDFTISPSHLPPEILGYNKKEENVQISNQLSLSLKEARKIFERNYLKEQLKDLREISQRHLHLLEWIDQLYIEN